MKKLFTLLALMLCYVGMAGAADVYTISFNGINNQSEEGYFTWNTEKHNFNSKFTGAEYGGISFTSGLKMEGATRIEFTSTATSTITIVQSTWSENTIKFDGTELTITDAVAGTGCRVYALTDISAGSHSITRGSGESGVFYVSVEYTGASMQQLEEPVITFDAATALVYIAGDANAESIKYTTDGSTPSKDNGIEYTAPFTVEDGTIVKAIAIGNDETTVSSGVSEKKVLVTGITISDPVIKSYNGTVAITCANPDAVIEYSLDGQTYNKYSYAFTLEDNATVYARASRDDCTTSGVVSAEINNVVKNVKTKTIYMGYGSFNEPEPIDGFSTLVGREGDAAYGYSLVLSGNSSKAWGKDGSGFKISAGGSERTGIKVSNGAQNTLVLPEGVIATKVTFYSYVNEATSTTKCGWKEINGQNINYNDIPMGAYSDVESRFSNPDVRVFPLDNVTGSFTFTNGGRQLCFIVALDVIEPYALTTTDTDFYGLYLPYQASVPEGITAYTGALSNDQATLTLSKVEGVIPANTAVLVKSNAVGEYTFNVSNEETADAIANNSLQGVTVETAVAELAKEGKTVLTLGVADGIVAFRQPAAGTIKANKVYLLVDAASSAKIRIVEGETTGIEENYEFGIKNSDAATYDLSGRKVANPTKGLYIKNGKKFIVK